MVAQLNFGGVKRTPANSNKKQYPHINPEDVGGAPLTEMCDQLIIADKQEKSSCAAKEAVQGQIKDLARPFLLTYNYGKPELVNAASIFASDGTEVLVTFKDAYKRFDTLEPLIQVIGNPLVEKYFQQSFILTLKSDQIPVAAMQAVIDGIVELLNRHNCVEALDAKPYFRPTREFSSARHRVLTVEQNLDLEAAMGGMTTMSVAPSRGRRS